MIHDHRAFIAFPANWEPPFFQLGETVKTGTTAGTIIGLEYLTREQAALTECAAGWWYWILEPRTLKCGREIADQWGQHESAIQRVPCSDVSVLQRVPSSAV